ncbi:HlyIII-domain-containing protein [Calocera cornea HHB12733]|uniref:HlyIII-domain-containing protein n=1 Tax=Calocera cornea HHB12733 TaxID=1353952 RepID=A0A165H8R7_9BASI|nr:HlyIII-domain-containing protein [Calocera cornea HHB12733]
MPPRQRKAAAANGRVAAAASAHTHTNGHGKASASAGKLTVSYHEAPVWMQDNEYIEGGYRRVTHNVIACLYSVFGYLHNESMNIHTHLWGTVTFLLLLGTVYIPLSPHHATVIWYDVVGFVTFLLSAIFCLGCSTMYHTLQCHSQEMSKRCHIMDYIGIVVLIVGSYYPTVYYGFYCDPWPRVGYVVVITIAGGCKPLPRPRNASLNTLTPRTVAMYIVLTPKYAQATWRWARTSVFLALGLCAVVPVTHAMYAYGYYRIKHEMGLDWLLASGALYVMGALIYGGRIPERFAPGKFDIFFTSHQIFHCFVVAAALCQYVCVVVALNHRHGVGLGKCPSP